MYTEKMLRIVNVKEQECWEMAMYAEKMLGIHNVYRKNARNRKCTQKKYSESSMYTEKILDIVNVKGKNARESTKRVENMLGIDNTRKEET